MTPFKAAPLAFKLIVIGILIVMVWIPTMIVFVLSGERSSRAAEAANEIAGSWGYPQTINGPIITIPIRTVTVQNNVRTESEDMIYILPDEVSFDAGMTTEERSRGIFETAVYTATLHATGTFTIAAIAGIQPNGTILWDKARLSVGIPDTRGIATSTSLTWEGAITPFEPGTSAVDIGPGMSAPIALSPAKNTYTFSFDTSLRGSQRFFVSPVGKATNVTMHANWPSPSFTGAFLPDSREITDAGFTAQWGISSFGRSTPQAWTSSSQTGIAAPYYPPIPPSRDMQKMGSAAMPTSSVGNTTAAAFGVDLIQTVDLYTQVNRAVKYSILFIGLTFLAFFMFEALAGLRIHPIHYLLVGLALALFYLLLLAFAETVGFLPAYLISTIATTGLITAYSASVLRAHRRAGIIAGLLIALFGYLYILLQLEELSLVFGSIMLFAVLSTVMYLTRNIDWYTFSTENKS